MKLSRLAIVLTTALALVVSSFIVSPAASAQGCAVAPAKKDAAPAAPAVVITGGTVSNSTTIDLNADGGTGIADASGGDNNIATNNGSTDDDGLGEIASAGNGGTANASANGGAISVGNVNSGGNSGNVITVGDTCVAAEAPKPAPEPKKPVAPAPKKPAPAPKAPRARGGDRVRALPSTGVGLIGSESGASGTLAALALIGAVTAAGVGLRRRFV